MSNTTRTLIASALTLGLAMSSSAAFARIRPRRARRPVPTRPPMPIAMTPMSR